MQTTARTIAEIKTGLLGVQRELAELRRRGLALEIELAEGQAEGRPARYWARLLEVAEEVEWDVWAQWELYPDLPADLMYARADRAQALTEHISARLAAAERVIELRAQTDFLD